MTHGTSTTSETPGTLDSALRWTGLGLHIAIGIFPLASSGLMAPPWALAVIAIVWMSALLGAWRLGTIQPRLTPLVPVVTVALWYGFMTAGDLWLGWVA